MLALHGLALSLRLNQKRLVAPGGCYVLIGLTRLRSGHAVAAYISNDVAFFDPNFGEFYFPGNAAVDANWGYNKSFVDWFLSYW